jgi:hypothetical protein
LENLIIKRLDGLPRLWNKVPPVKAIITIGGAALAALAALVAGCTALAPLEPNAVTPELTHLSHATQHFGADPTHYGADIADLSLEWKLGRGFFFSLAEGAVLERQQGQGFGEIEGPREQFIGRIGYRFQVKE